MGHESSSSNTAAIRRERLLAGRGNTAATLMVVPELTNEGLARLFSSVYRQYLTVDEGGQFGSKEHHRIGDIQWVPRRFIAIRSTSAFCPSSP
jgi:hypothetical protein